MSFNDLDFREAQNENLWNIADSWSELEHTESDSGYDSSELDICNQSWFWNADLAEEDRICQEDQIWQEEQDKKPEPEPESEPEQEQWDNQSQNSDDDFQAELAAQQMADKLYLHNWDAFAHRAATIQHNRKHGKRKTGRRAPERSERTKVTKWRR